MRAAFALRINSGRMIFNLQFWKICGFSRIAFSREGSWREAAFAAPLSTKARRCGRALAPPSGGAVAQRLRGYGWRSEKSVKAIAPTGAALAFCASTSSLGLSRASSPWPVAGGWSPEVGRGESEHPSLPLAQRSVFCSKQIPLPAAPLQMLLFSRKKITERPQTFRYAEMYNNF